MLDYLNFQACAHGAKKKQENMNDEATFLGRCPS